MDDGWIMDGWMDGDMDGWMDGWMDGASSGVMCYVCSLYLLCYASGSQCR